jgi:hypothetical protein
MLRALRRHAVLVGTTELLIDAIRYVAVMLIVLLLLGQFAKLAF